MFTCSSCEYKWQCGNLKYQYDAFCSNHSGW